ncbi:MAG: Shikimate dehydrogenase [Actinobacteria bacterium]|nr:Shikimate dehydrogenase [Actinomycetota bacterium]
MTRLEQVVARGGPESLLFIVGHPLSHSLSPAMHNAVISRLGLRLRYIGVDLPVGHLPDFFRVVREGNFLGGNVTIPHKEEAASLADERSEAVEVCGAANVIRVRERRLRAENTDGRGFLDAVAEAGWGGRFRKVVILGAGGSARGIAYELCRSGAREMTILNRRASRAEGIASVLSPRFPGTNISAGKLETAVMVEEFRGADLIVQCTSLGLRGEWENFPVETVEKTTRFADIVYRQGGTELVRRLKKRRISAIDGLGMLAHQAARSFFIWTGKRVPGGEFLSVARKTVAAG